MIVFNNHEHGHAIAEAAEFHFNPAVDVVISREERGELWGGVVFTDFTGASIGIHVASFRPDWINRDMLWVTFNYPFKQLRCKKLFGQIPSSNQRALEFDLKLGFKVVARIPDVFPGGDLIVVSMDRDECRWLKLKPRTLQGGGVNGQK